MFFGLVDWLVEAYIVQIVGWVFISSSPSWDVVKHRCTYWHRTGFLLLRRPNERSLFVIWEKRSNRNVCFVQHDDPSSISWYCVPKNVQNISEHLFRSERLFKVVAVCIHWFLPTCVVWHGMPYVHGALGRNKQRSMTYLYKICLRSMQCSMTFPPHLQIASIPTCSWDWS